MGRPRKDLIKVGKNRKGVQRFYNRLTGKYELESTTRIPIQVKLFSIYLYMSGLSFRRVGDIIGVANSTVLNWFNTYHHLFNDVVTDNQEVMHEDVEVDELFTYLKKNIKKSTSG